MFATVRVLYHHRTLGDGAEGVHIASIVKALRALGHDVHLAAAIGPATGQVSRRAAMLARLKSSLPRPVLELAELAMGLAEAAVLAAQIRRLRPDLLYQRYACANYAGVLASRAGTTPHVLEVNAPIARERQVFEDGLVFARTMERMEDRVFRAADRCIAVSTPLANHLVSVGVLPSRVEVMPNGADPSRYEPSVSPQEAREALAVPEAPTVGFLGVMREWHGVDLLIRAVARSCSDEVRVLLVGDGPDAKRLLQVAAQEGIGGRVQVTGRVDHEAVPRWLAACDVCVSPRSTPYASPMKIPEYMAAGRAVVAPCAPNIANLVSDQQTGILFEPESLRSLGEALRALLTDGARRAELAAAARREVERRLNWRRNARRIVEMVTEICEER